MPDLDPATKALIAERVGELAERETLSKTRVEAVELALTDLADRGEWPPPEDIDPTELELALEEANKAAALIDTLRAELTSVRSGGDKGGRALTGEIMRGVLGTTLAIVRARVPGFGSLSKEAQNEIRQAIGDAIRPAIAQALGVEKAPPGALR